MKRLKKMLNGDKMEYNSSEEQKNVLVPKTMKNLVYVFVLGIILLFAGNFIFDTKEQPEETSNKRVLVEQKKIEKELSYEEKMEKRLIEILEKMQGVGKVDVMITITYGEEMILAEDVRSNESTTHEEDTNGGTRQVSSSDTQASVVFQSENGSKDVPIIVKQKQPEIRGVLILAEGGDNTIIKDRLTKASQTLLGVPVHKVQVFPLDRE